MFSKIIISLITRHILGIVGIVSLIFMLLYNINLSGIDGYFHLGRLDKIIILAGILLIIFGFIPERIRTLLIKYPFLESTDKFLGKYSKLSIVFLLIIGFFLRFNNLGQLSFMYDELTMTFTAIDILKYGSPIKYYFEGDYTRSILNTSIIAFFFKIFGISEFSARLSSVIFGTLTILLVYLMGIKFANKRVAILAAIIITFSGWEILWSREARMYAQFQFFYLLVSYLFYVGLNNNKYNKTVLSFSVIAFICSILSHRLIFIFLPVASIYFLTYKRTMINFKLILYGSISVLGVLLLSNMSFNSIRGYLLMNNIPPVWGQNPFYYYAIVSDLNVMFFMIFISILASYILWKCGLCKVNEKKVYLLLNFFIPFIVISMFPWKISRYAFFLFPFLVILASYAIDYFVIRNAINTNVCSKLSKNFKFEMRAVCNIRDIFLSVIIILFVTQFLLFFVYQPSDAMHLNWKKGSEYVKYNINDGDKIATTSISHGLYYLGKVDYEIKQYNDRGVPLDNMNSLNGTIRLYNYTLFLETIETTKGWMVVDNALNTHLTDIRVKAYIENNMTYHSEGSDDTLKVFSWNIPINHTETGG